MTVITPAATPDALADARPPSAFINDLGWQDLPLDGRVRMIMAEAQRRIEGAAHALFSQCAHTEAGRAQAIQFVAHTLLDEARRMRRALDAQMAEKDAASAPKAKRNRRAAA